MITKELITLGVVGYLATTMRAVPITIGKFLGMKFSKSISVNSNNSNYHEKLENWILSLDVKTINNHSYLDEQWNRDSLGEYGYKGYIGLGQGEFLTNISSLTWMYVSKNIINQQTSEMKTTVIFFGKDKEKFYKECVEFCSKKDEEFESIRVFPFKDDFKSIIQPKRSFDTIFNKEKYEVIEHINKWKSLKEVYVKNGIINKTGILLYGEHGLGKSSIARAIASYLDYSLHVISLKSFKNQNELINRVSNIRPNSVILFEDIDCCVGSRENNDDSSLLGVVLNLLDGSLSPSDVVFVATTNYIEKLDKALIRDGRFDLKIEMSRIGVDVVKDMCEYYGVELEVNEDNYNPSEVMNKILSKLGGVK
ncbi:MAG: AAA family ATPase [Sarcina sp.]